MIPNDDSNPTGAPAETSAEATISAADVRVNVGDLAKAVRAIEVRREAEARHLANTITLGDAVKQLDLDVTPDELLFELGKQGNTTVPPPATAHRRDFNAAAFAAALGAAALFAFGLRSNGYPEMPAHPSMVMVERYAPSHTMMNPTTDINVLPTMVDIDAASELGITDLASLNEGDRTDCDFDTLVELNCFTDLETLHGVPFGSGLDRLWTVEMNDGEYEVVVFATSQAISRGRQGEKIQVYASPHTDLEPFRVSAIDFMDAEESFSHGRAGAILNGVSATNRK